MFPILYSRNSNGSVQQWQIEVDQQNGRYRTTSGQVGGAQNETDWTDCIGKNIGKSNETSPGDQAVLEATAKVTKKKERGYFEDINEIDNLVFKEPMRANEYKKRHAKGKVIFPGSAQFKFDGFRANPNPDTNEIVSRYNNPITAVPHINALLAQFHAKNPDIRLDGELYSHAYKDDFNTLCKILRKQTPSAEEIKRAEVMEFWCFDLIDEKLTWLERLARLKEIWKEWHPIFGKTIRLVWTTSCATEAEYDAFHQKAIREGFEGSMWRNDDGFYKFSRCDELLKRKEFTDAEFELKDVLPGRGNKANLAAKIVCYRDAAKVVTFESNITGDWTFCKELLENKADYIGKQATIKFQNYTPLKADGTGAVPRQGYMVKLDKF